MKETQIPVYEAKNYPNDIKCIDSWSFCKIIDFIYDNIDGSRFYQQLYDLHGLFNSYRLILTFREIRYLIETIDKIIYFYKSILHLSYSREGGLDGFELLDELKEEALSELIRRFRLIKKHAELYYFLEAREIFFLCHFTPKDNLDSIFENGLLTKDSLSEYTPTDNFRFDMMNNALCFSVSKPNKFMFDRKNTNNNLALILLDIEILFDKRCLFFQHNAACKGYHYDSIEECIDKHSGTEAFKSLFNNEIEVEKSMGYDYFSRNSQALYSAETTSAQAEIQCLDNVEYKYFLNVFAYDFDDCEVAVYEPYPNTRRYEYELSIEDGAWYDLTYYDFTDELMSFDYYELREYSLHPIKYTEGGDYIYTKKFIIDSSYYPYWAMESDGDAIDDIDLGF